MGGTVVGTEIGSGTETEIYKNVQTDKNMDGGHSREKNEKRMQGQEQGQRHK